MDINKVWAVGGPGGAAASVVVWVRGCASERSKRLNAADNSALLHLFEDSIKKKPNELRHD